MEDEMIILKVTTEENYIVPMHNDKITKINGWSIEEVVKDWFVTHALTPSHATRDAHKIGNSRKFIKIEVKGGENRD